MSQLTINTTQNVNINFTAASVGERIGAFFIDLLVMISYSIIIMYLVFNKLGLDNWLDTLDFWSAIAISILFFLPIFFYTLVQEVLFEGQTFGKKIVKIKVVKIDGYQASFLDYFMRWLFRILDVWSNNGIVGLITMVVSSKTQRLGDMVAGTAVITLKNKISIDHTILEEIGEEYQPQFPLVIKLSDNDARIIKETFESAYKKGDFVILNKLINKIEQVTGIKNEMGSSEKFIKTILKDYNYYTQKM